MQTYEKMSRLRNLRSQVDDLKQEKDRLEAENAHLKETLQAEVDRLREENERLQEESDATAVRGETRLEEERSETEKLLEEQRQLYEDLQAELAEAVERGNSLEDRCSSLEDKMLQMIEESQVERLKAVDAIRTKYEETLLPQMQELQQQVRKLQESQSRTSAPAEENPAEPDKQLSKETTGSKEGTRGADSNKTTGSTQVTTTATADPKSDNTGHKAEAIGDTDKQHSTANELSTALLAQQLPPLPKYNGSSDSSEETF